LCRGDPIGAHAEASISNKLKRETLAATFFWRASRRWSWMAWRWRKFSQEAIWFYWALDFAKIFQESRI
jgi:hypothetical protein